MRRTGRWRSLSGLARIAPSADCRSRPALGRLGSGCMAYPYGVLSTLGEDWRKNLQSSFGENLGDKVGIGQSAFGLSPYSAGWPVAALCNATGIWLSENGLFVHKTNVLRSSLSFYTHKQAMPTLDFA